MVSKKRKARLMNLNTGQRRTPESRGATGTRIRLGLLGVCVGLLFTVGIGSVHAQERARREYEIKAAFMFNFIRFVDWPGTALDARAPVSLCVMGADVVDDAFRALETKQVRGRAITFTQIGGVEEVVACHVVFIAGPADGPQLDVLQTVAGKPTLTVGETPGFNTAGGMIAFVYRKNQLRFAVNLEPAERAGVKIRSDLLSLASEVSAPGRGP